MKYKRKMKIKEQQKKNIIVSAIFLIMQYAISINVFLMGDDFMYAVFAQNGCMKSVWQYYFTGNGRWLINLIDSMVLKCDRFMYIIILPWMMLLLGALCYKIIVIICKKEISLLYPISLLLISILDISITRETVYWITGSINYLIPLLLFLFTVYFTLKLCEKNDYTIFKKCILGCICVMACTTMEQFALMSLGFMLLMLIKDFLMKRSIEKCRLVIIIFSILGICTILFSPGNMIRMSKTSESGLNIILKILDLIYYNIQSIQATRYLVILLVCEGFFLYNRKRVYSVLAFGDAVILLLPLVSIHMESRMSIVGLCIFIMCITSYMTYIEITNKEIKYDILIFIILFMGSQFFVFLAGIMGFRTTLSTTIGYILFCLLMINICDNKNIEYGVVNTIVLFINPFIGIVMLVVRVIGKVYKGQARITKIPLNGVISLILMLSLLPIAIGYNNNRKIHMENIRAAQMNNVSKIVIRNYEDYGWNSPPLGAFHEKYFRLYYGIEKECEIEYEENDNKNIQ